MSLGQDIRNIFQMQRLLYVFLYTDKMGILRIAFSHTAVSEISFGT